LISALLLGASFNDAVQHAIMRPLINATVSFLNFAVRSTVSHKSETESIYALSSTVVSSRRLETGCNQVVDQTQ
jgi:hypothetical protein